MHDNPPSKREATPWIDLSDKRIPYTLTDYVDAQGCYYYVLEAQGVKKMYKREVLKMDAPFELWHDEQYLLHHCAKMRKTLENNPSERFYSEIRDNTA